MSAMSYENRIFLQKRVKTKKIQPGKWDTAVGGHVNSGELIEDALKRETEEELNIKDIKTSFIGKYVWETSVESEIPPEEPPPPQAARLSAIALEKKTIMARMTALEFKLYPDIFRYTLDELPWFAT